MAVSRRRPQPEEVEHLLLNAQLRDEIEPFLDESITTFNVSEMPTPVENDLLRSMLAWERAPVLPIAHWFQPELVPPSPESLDDEQLHEVLWDLIQKLYDKHIVLDFTDHLSDRQLYTLILRDILPALEKKLDAPDNYLHWDCADASGDPELWLKYYATPQERELWQGEFDGEMPPRQSPPFRRRLPGPPL